VAGRGARIALDFVEPGGAGTGRLLPTGRALDRIEGLACSLVDATNPVVFFRAADLGLTGTETPTALDADRALSERLEGLRVAAAHLMGIPGSAAVPKIAVVAAPIAFTALDGVAHGHHAVDLVGRAISMGNCHRAFPLTVAMCLAVAARIPGTVVRECSTAADGADIRLGHPSGVLPIDAHVAMRGGEPWAERVTTYRTARRLMEGWVRVP
jgi:hypothetical protein